MGEDDAVEKSEAIREGILEGAPDERTAVGLQMRLGQADLFSRAEQTQGVGPGGNNDLLRCVGTESPDDLPPALRLEPFSISVRIGQGFTAFNELLHQSFSLSIVTVSSYHHDFKDVIQGHR